MLSATFILSLSVLLLVNVVIADHSEPLDVQVDLLFPQNNKIYKPVYPFPILFGYHNFTLSWQYKPSFEWWLVRIDPPGNQQQTGWTARGIIGKSDPTSKIPPPDDFFPINYTKAISMYNESSWELNYAFTIGGPKPCTASIPGGANSHVAKTGKIVFQTSYDNGVMPNIFEGGGVGARGGAWVCGKPLFRIGIPTQEAKMKKDFCLEEEEPRPEPLPCALRADEATRQRIVGEMTKRSGCPEGVTWPTGTGIGTKCGQQWSEKEKSGVEGRARWSLSAMVVTIATLGSSFWMASSLTLSW